MARNVPDAAAFAAVMEDVPIPRFERRTEAPRVAFCRSPAWPDAEPELGPAMQEGLDRLRSAGARIVERELPRSFDDAGRSEEHTSELQSLMRISYAVFCLKKKKKKKHKLPYD